MPVRPLAAAALAAASLAVVPAAATAAQTTLATVPAAAAVSAYGTTVAWSALDPATDRYALTVSVAGQQQAPPVAPRTVPFDVDAGLGPDGATWLVYSRCTTEGKGGRPGKGCDLYGYSLAGGASEVKLAASGSGSEIEPAISGNRVVFARGGAVYAGPVRGSGASRRVRGAIPARTCDTIDGRCVTIERPQVQGLDLAGKRVAVVSYWNSVGKYAVGIGQTALVLAPVSGGGGATAVTTTVVGMNGQSFVGPTFAGNAVGWFYGCPGLLTSCGGRNAGSWLYDLSSRRYSLARSTAAPQSYAALPNRQAVELLPAAGNAEQACPFATSATDPCSVVQVDGLSYRAAKKPSLPIRLAS
jgi:hypothetical protein